MFACISGSRSKLEKWIWLHFPGEKVESIFYIQLQLHARATVLLMPLLSVETGLQCTNMSGGKVVFGGGWVLCRMWNMHVASDNIHEDPVFFFFLQESRLSFQKKKSLIQTKQDRTETNKGVNSYNSTSKSFNQLKKNRIHSKLFPFSKLCLARQCAAPLRFQRKIRFLKKIRKF